MNVIELDQERAISDETMMKLREFSARYADAMKTTRSSAWCGHPQQLECARRLFELWPEVSPILRTLAK